MERCDFLLTYEIRNREIESVCLLKRELERRGHSVLVREQYAPFFGRPEPVDAKVVVVPAYYRERVRFYTAAHTPVTRKVVNLQWEQVFAKSRGQKGSLNAIKPWGFDATHISWGEDNRRRLVDEYGVPEERAVVAGHLAMDFLREPLRGYYLSRTELCERYGLSEAGEISLFISSFTRTTSHRRFVENACSTDEERAMAEESRVCAVESQKAILEWFDDYLSEDGSRTVVYRPHPEEGMSEAVRRMDERHANFRVIRDESVKQWIVAADRIFTWVSTSIAEVFFAGKSCTILNPLPLPAYKMMRTYDGASVISTREGFFEALRSERRVFPVPEESIRRVYAIDESRLSYEIVCDALERVLEDDAYDLDEPLRNPFEGLLNKERALCFVKRRVAASRLCHAVRAHDWLQGTTLRKNIDDVLYVKEKLARNHVTDSEMDEIVGRIDAALAASGTRAGREVGQ